MGIAQEPPGMASSAGRGVPPGRAVSRVPRYGAVLPAVLLVALVVVLLLFFPDARGLSEPPLLVPLLNTVVLFAPAALISYVAVRSYLLGGATAVLLLGSGVLTGGVGACLAGWLAAPGGPNAGITIFSTSLFAAALFHAGSAAMGRQPEPVAATRSRRWRRLMCGYLCAVAIPALVSVAALSGVTPPFFVHGVGAMPVGQAVLVGALLLFGISSARLLLRFRQTRAAFQYWYALALLLLAVSVVGVLVPPTAGSPLAWAGRSAHSVAIVYFLLAAFAASRQARGRGVPMDEAVAGLFRGAEAYWQDLLATVGEAIISCDDRGRILQWNRAAERIFGYRRAEVTGKGLGLILPEGAASDASHLAAGHTQIGGVLGMDLVRKDGASFPGEVSLSVARLPQGEVTTLVVRDATERHRIEEAQRESEELLRAVVEGIPDPVYIKDREGRIMMANPAAAEVVGRPLEEIIGRTDAECYRDTAAGQALREHDLRVMTSGQSEAMEETVPTPIGRRTFLSTKAPRRDGRGQIIGIVGISHDITARQQVQRERERLLAEVERQARVLDAILANTPCELAYLDRGLRYVRVNAAYAENARMAPEQFVGRHRLEMFPNAPEVTAMYQRVVDTGEPATIDEYTGTRRYRPEAGPRTIRVDATPIKNARGEVEGLVASMVDMTESVRQRERLVAAEHARAEIAEHLNDEIAHRVKNNLAMVSGLLQMQLLSEKEEGTRVALREAVGRIRTFADLHDRMYASRSEQVDLLAVLEQVGETTAFVFADRQDIAITVQGDRYACSSRTATNLSVVANELITNALKYGGPGADGRLEVRVGLEQTGEGVAVSVWNSGNPVREGLATSERLSMGLRLVWDLVVSQYRGRFLLRPHGGGTLAEVSIPAGSVAADVQPRAGEEPSWTGRS